MDDFNKLQFKPMLASPGQPFDSKDYLFEIKWDGYRSLAYLSDSTRLVSRNLKDFTPNYPNLADLHLKVKERPAVLDGEIITLEDGKPTFQGLQGLQKNKPAIFMAFDILYLKGRSLVTEPLLTRKKILEQVVQEDHNLLCSQYVFEFGRAFFQQCQAKQLEGMMAKEVHSPYWPGKRVEFWRKIKVVQEDDFLILGYLPGQASPIGSLILGQYGKKGIIYKGLVGTGLKESFKEQLLDLFQALRTEENPFGQPIAELAQAVFLKPYLVGTVVFLEETKEGRLRHPSFQRLRADKFAQDLIN